MKSELQISLERKAWARGRLLVAWLKVSRAAEDETLTPERFATLERELHDAMAIAREWGIDCTTIVEEAERAS